MVGYAYWKVGSYQEKQEWCSGAGSCSRDSIGWTPFAAR